MSEREKGQEPQDVSAEDILTAFTIPEETYDLALPNGMVITCKTIRSVEQITQISNMADMLRKLEKASPAWKPYLPIGQKEALILAQFKCLVIRPKFSDLQVLRMTRQAGPLAEFVHRNILLSMVKQAAAAESQELEEIKNASMPEEMSSSGETFAGETSGETTSPSAETSSENTPTPLPPTSGNGPESSLPSP